MRMLNLLSERYTADVRLDMGGDVIDVVKFLLTERADEILCGVDRRVIDEVVLTRKGVVALLAAVLFGVTGTMLHTEMSGNI